MKMKFNTELLHNSFMGDKATGATVMPIYQTSAFAYPSPEKLEDVFNNKAFGFAYTRIGNPTVSAFENRMVVLEKGIGAIACASGMSAITLSLLNVLSAGDEIIASSGLFGGTIDLFQDLQSFGITTRFVRHIEINEIAPLINDKTKVVFAELIGNPALDIVDIDNVSAFLHQKGIPFFIDSTTATPYLIRPIEHGADIVIHSTSKYINGGGNAVSGVIIDSGNFRWDTERYPALAQYGKFGKFAYLSRLRNGIWRNIGACLSPMNAFMNMVGMETLALRMERIGDNALKLAEFFSSVEGIEVNYPSLPSSPYYERCRKLFDGKGGAIITIRTGSRKKAFAVMNRLHIPLIATNIGDVRTLVIHPASTIYTHSDIRKRENAGVYDDTIRISVGIEDIDDLTEDFAQAFAGLKEE